MLIKFRSISFCLRTYIILRISIPKIFDILFNNINNHQRTYIQVSCIKELETCNQSDAYEEEEEQENDDIFANGGSKASKKSKTSKSPLAEKIEKIKSKKPGYV